MTHERGDDVEKALRMLAEHGTGIEYPDHHPDGIVCLAETQVADADLSSLIACQSFVSLDLSGTGITNSGLEPVGEMRQLEHLHLYETDISDAGLACIGNLTSLNSLDISANPG